MISPRNTRLTRKAPNLALEDAFITYSALIFFGDETGKAFRQSTNTQHLTI
jgi:hypothetical protein